MMMIVTEPMSCRFGIRAPLHTCWDSIILPDGSSGPRTGSLRRTDLPLAPGSRPPPVPLLHNGG